jgi:TonB family protein
VPTHPPSDLTSHREAEVVLKAGVDKTGRVRTVDVVRSGGTFFDAEAIKAMFRTTFTPARDQNGKPVDCYITFNYLFKLPVVDGAN